MTESFDNTDFKFRSHGNASGKTKLFIRIFSGLFGVCVIIFSVAASALDISESNAFLSVRYALSYTVNAAQIENKAVKNKAEILFSPDTVDRIFLHSNAIDSHKTTADNVPVTPTEESIENNTEIIAEAVVSDVSASDIFGTFVYSDLSGNPVNGEILLRNETGYSPDVAELQKRCDSASVLALLSEESGKSEKQTVNEISDEENDTVLYTVGENISPVVLILHTHGTECYNTDGNDNYTEDEACFRSGDTDINMISVGREAAITFAEGGVPVLHCRIMHDIESYNNSYYYESQTIQKLLSLYPSIRFILDMHRDAVGEGDNCMVRPVTSTAYGDAAQIMFVCGSDWLGAVHPNWEENLALAVLLQSGMNTQYKNIMRPICLRGATYNEHFTSGSLLVEIGSCGNSLEEAKLSARLLANQLAVYINNGVA